MNRAVVTGMIGTYPVGGVVWDYGQYILGLQRLGFAVTYLEDTGMPAYDPARGLYEAAPAEAAAALAAALDELAPGVEWHYRGEDGSTFGLAGAGLADALAEADVFLNVSGSCLRRPAYRHARRAVLIDTDPGYNHYVNYPRWEAQPRWGDAAGFRDHDAFFTYATRLAESDCPLPDFGLRWHPTRPPVVLDAWEPEPPGERWTTIMTWSNFKTPIAGDGVTYGTKEREFGALEDLPAQTGAPLEVAVGGSDPPVERWREKGWSVVPAREVSESPSAYRDYVERSRGELSVAKNVYAATRCGWFSCRSVCYLAAGRPCVLQDTGWSDGVPSGDGLLAFTTPEQARDAVCAVEADYDRHARAARALAEEEFGSDVVLADLLDRAGV